MSNANKNTQKPEENKTQTPTPQQAPEPTGIAIETLRQMFPGMSDENIGELIRNMGAQYRIEQCKRVAAQTAEPAQQEIVHEDYCEVQEPQSAPVQNQNGGNTMTNATPTTAKFFVRDNRRQEFYRDLERAGLNTDQFITLYAKGKACGELDYGSYAEVCRRADWYRGCDRREQLAIDQAARKAEMEAKAAAAKSKAPLTTGQKIWIGIGIAAVVLIVGGAVWWIISKKKADAAFSEEFDSSTEDRCNRIFAQRNLCI